ncbi:MAG: hypothetical protein E8D44_16045 [Nitrospira sp.]|nr:MAG: hypothetical protein E8D44_16045 [Nitrospira sp.]
MTTWPPVGILSNVKAVELFRRRVVYSENAFAELILWRVQKPIAGSQHPFKYRLAYVVNEVCVLRFDNEAGKGDHRHVGGKESPYTFTTPEKLIADFQREVARWDHENGHT